MKQYALDASNFERSVRRRVVPSAALASSLVVQRRFSGFETVLRQDPTDPSESPAVGSGGNWWFDFGPHTLARNQDTGDDIHGGGQWKDRDNRPPIDRQGADPSRGSGRWEFERSPGRWQAIDFSDDISRTVEEAFCDGAPHLPYSCCYRGRCPCWASDQRCTATPSGKHPDNHQYYIDFERMVQIDIFFPLDLRRTKRVRREPPATRSTKRARHSLPP